MPTTFAVFAAQRTIRLLGSRITRTTLLAAGVLGVLAGSASSVAAQTASRATTQGATSQATPASANPASQPKSPARWELLFTGGAFVPTGSQRDALTDAQVSAAQLSWLVRPQLAITGTFAWARSRDLVAANRPKLDVFSSDVGVEVRPSAWFAERMVSFSPFAGVGVGARSYNHRSLNVDASNNIAGYASVGGEVGVRRVGVRLEMRDYATGFKPLMSAGRSEARNDLVLMLGLRITRARTSQPLPAPSSASSSVPPSVSSSSR